MEGAAFQGPESRLNCTLFARWDPGHNDPWLVLTDLDPRDCSVAWYGVRTWIEQGFKCIKRGGWQWQATRMDDPARAEYPLAGVLWLALTVATFWVIAVGDATEQEATLPVLADLAPPPARLFPLGLLSLLVAAIAAQPLPLPGILSPDRWPGDPHRHPTAHSTTLHAA